MSPNLVYTQLIDNRDLPPDVLRKRPPFEPTDRSQIANMDEKTYIILDNADDINIQDFTEADTSETVMLGNVRIRFDGSFLRAERVIVTIKDSVVINVGAYGNIEFTLNGTKYLADSMNYQPDMERGVMYNVRSIMGANLIGSGEDERPWFYRAEKVTIQSQTRFVLDNVYLSTSDTRFDHFSLKVKKLWYLQGKVALILGLEYLTGQATFLWLPAYLQLEGGGGVRTSFGSEKRIGYYFINNYSMDTKIGAFDFGFDFYERQGQYFQMEYEAPQTGMLQRFKFDVNLANDIRIIKNGDLFSQWVQPQFNDATDLQRMSQFAWRYKLDTAIGTNGVLFSANFEDLNDPFFMQKYSYRTRFDDSDSINFMELINPGLNSWFGYQGDAQPQINTITRSLSLAVGNLNISSSWELLRVTKPDVSNQFLNTYYDYELRSVTLPTLTYNFGTLDLVDYDYTTKSRIIVLNSDGSSNEMHINKLPEYEDKLSERSNRSVSREVLLQNDGSYQTNVTTNWAPITVTNIITNDYRWIDISLNAQADFSFSAQRTLGTNDLSSVSDPSLLNTNWITIADVNKHEEKGTMNFSIDLFDNLWSIDNSFNFNYREQWSSFAENFTNSQRDSGMRIDYRVGTAIQPQKIWDPDDWNRVSINFNTSVNYSYPLYYLLRLQEDFVRESQLTWQNSINLEFMQLQRESIFNLELRADWNIRDRVPTIDQQIIIDDDPNDFFIDNRIFDRVTLGASTKIFWINIGTELTVDILETKTNDDPDIFRPILGSSITNRFIGEYPKLLVEFRPDSKYHYLPKLTYKYNLFEKSWIGIGTNANAPPGETGIEQREFRKDKSFSLEFLWDVRLRNYQIPALYPFIYELSEFGFVMQYYHDFINVRNSYLRLDFVIGIKFTKYLTFRFTSQMMNNKIYLYYKNGVYNGQDILAPGEITKEFWSDLGDGLKIWDQNALKSSSFKLQSLSFELIHDLQTWDMRVIFNLGRRIDEVKQIAFWEPYIGVAFTMKGSNAADIFPEFQKRFVPAEYQ